MDEVDVSQTCQYMHRIDRGRGTRFGAEEARKPKWLSNRWVERAMCELQWMDLTTCDVSVSPEAVICQIHVREIIYFLDNGLEIRVRCGGWIRQLYVEIK